MPERIQLRRVKGWRLPFLAKSFAPPTRWGNPWRVGLISCACRSAGECSHNAFRCETAAEAVEQYRWWLTNSQRLLAALPELRGRNLACWCRLDQPCHADVLLDLANRDHSADAGNIVEGQGA